MISREQQLNTMFELELPVNNCLFDYSIESTVFGSSCCKQCVSDPTQTRSRSLDFENGVLSLYTRVLKNKI